MSESNCPSNSNTLNWIVLNCPTEVAGGFTCPAAGEIAAGGSFSRHAHPDDCRKYYICLEGVAREYGCPIGTVFKIGDAEGSGNCEDPEDVPGWLVFFFIIRIGYYCALKTIKRKQKAGLIALCNWFYKNGTWEREIQGV